MGKQGILVLLFYLFNFFMTDFCFSFLASLLSVIIDCEQASSRPYPIIGRDSIYSPPPPPPSATGSISDTPTRGFDIFIQVPYV
jgi:hypothetical protein